MAKFAFEVSGCAADDQTWTVAGTTTVKRGDLHPLVANAEADRINTGSPHTTERFLPPDSTTLDVSQYGNGHVSLLLKGSEVARAAAVPLSVPGSSRAIRPWV